jgi:GT2 family glycosyltransferase
MNDKNPSVSVIIPSMDGSRDGMLPALKRQLEEQTLQDYELIVKVGDNRQGRAINNGAKEARGRYLVVMDDDIVLGRNDVLEKLVSAMDADPRIGMGGASLSVWEKANWLQKRVMIEVPRYTSPVVDQVTESDLACHGCCIFRKEVFFQVGAEREDIIRGLDPDLRMRLRRAGYTVVLVPQTWFYHLPPARFGAFLKKCYRNGKGSSYIQIHRPELIYETHTGKGKFVEKRSFVYRICRYPLRLADNLLHGRFIAWIGEVAYAAGFVHGYISYARQKNAPSEKNTERTDTRTF